MANLIGDTISKLITALMKDSGTQTPAGLTPADIERVRLELNRLQGNTLSESEIKRKARGLAAGRAMVRQ